VNREEQIKKMARKLLQQDLGVTDDYFIAGHGNLEMTYLIQGAHWADENPDRERISEFTDNQIEENFRLNKLLNEALRALGAILFYGTHNGDGTTTECEMVYLADDALKMIAQMKKEGK
jgi:hypothetical protein